MYNMYMYMYMYCAVYMYLQSTDAMIQCVLCDFHMQGYMKPKTYIATQGPIPESIGDFWRMVWEQDSRTVIMLTNPFEKGKLKCEVYWPREIGASTMHGNIEVTLTEMTQLADYTIRNFSIHKVMNYMYTCISRGVCVQVNVCIRGEKLNL